MNVDKDGERSGEYRFRKRAGLSWIGDTRSFVKKCTVTKGIDSAEGNVNANVHAYCRAARLLKNKERERLCHLGCEANVMDKGLEKDFARYNGSTMNL